MAESVLAEINSFGARVCVVGTDGRMISAPTKDACPSRGSLGGRMISAPTEGVPEWVTVGQGLMAARCREYEQETGHWPDRGLLERFSAEMGRRLEEFIRDPKGKPWRAVGLRKFEEEIVDGR